MNRKGLPSCSHLVPQCYSTPETRIGGAVRRRCPVQRLSARTFSAGDAPGGWAGVGTPGLRFPLHGSRAQPLRSVLLRAALLAPPGASGRGREGGASSRMKGTPSCGIPANRQVPAASGQAWPPFWPPSRSSAGAGSARSRAPSLAPAGRASSCPSRLRGSLAWRPRRWLRSEDRPRE